MIGFKKPGPYQYVLCLIIVLFQGNWLYSQNPSGPLGTAGFYELQSDGTTVIMVNERSKGNNPLIGNVTANGRPSPWQRLNDGAKVAIVHQYIKKIYRNNDNVMDENGLLKASDPVRFIASQSNSTHPNRVIGGYQIGTNPPQYVYANNPENPGGAPSWMEITDPGIPAPQGLQARAQVPRGYFPLSAPVVDGVDFTQLPVWNIQ